MPPLSEAFNSKSHSLFWQILKKLSWQLLEKSSAFTKIVESLEIIAQSIARQRDSKVKETVEKRELCSSDEEKEHGKEVIGKYADKSGNEVDSEQAGVTH